MRRATRQPSFSQSAMDGWVQGVDGDEKEAQMTMNLNPKCHNWGLFTFNLSTYC